MTAQNEADTGQQSSDWLSVEDAKFMTGKSKPTIRRWARNGKIEAEKKDGSWAIKATSLPQNSRSQFSQQMTGSEGSQLADKLIELAEEKAVLEEQLNRSLPSGLDTEDVDKMTRTLRKLSTMPFVRYLIPKDLRDEVT